MKLVGKAYCRRKDSHVDYRCWFVLKDFCALYASHCIHLRKITKEPTIADESEPATELESERTIVDELEP